MRVTQEMIEQQRAEINAGIEHVRAMALTSKADIERLDKLERIAQKWYRVNMDGESYFAVGPDGELMTCLLPAGGKWFRSLREAIDAAEEPK